MERATRMIRKALLTFWLLKAQKTRVEMTSATPNIAEILNRSDHFPTVICLSVLQMGSKPKMTITRPKITSDLFFDESFLNSSMIFFCEN